MMWFKENIPQHKTSLTVDDLRLLIVRYLHRFDLENKSEKKEAENCSISMAIDMTNELAKQEVQEFATIGLLVPNLTSKENLAKFMKWNGEIDKMVAFPMVRIKKSTK
ncbi:unnamed protein product [Hydatigera taeniaeformis]|uniref:LisH domain-containing protein n=1 Tax=Hydatigena taeniaeformis TaxID=6205 RepID=A0A0R3WHW5_HYDTA|nr:unnamed protein product [Hydatigera taeniaeformis]